MTSRSRIALALVGMLAIGGLFWMRSLASLRPKKLGRLPPGISQVDIFSPNGRFAILRSPRDSNVILSLDLETQNVTMWPPPSAPDAPSPWLPLLPLSPSLIGSAQIAQGKAVFHWRDIATGQTKGTLRWKSHEQFTCIARMSDDGKVLRILNSPKYMEWDIATKKLIHSVELQNSWPYDSDTPRTFAIAPDGARILGACSAQTRIWDARTGKIQQQQETITSSRPRAYSFSSNAQWMVFPAWSGFPWANWSVLDVQTGQKKWQYTSNYFLPFSTASDEVALPRKDNCEIRAASTGRVLRKLPGPRLSDGRILALNHDHIYTMNSKNEIFRWRAH